MGVHELADPPDPADQAAALQTIHAALADFRGPLPPFHLELDDARRLLEPDRSPALAPGDRGFLRDAVDEFAGLRTEMRPLHGSPHAGNWLATADGWLLGDFETVCRGPIEWDVSALDDAAIERFPNLDHALIGRLRRMRSVCVAVKCWVEPTRAPEVFEAAHVHLKLLRGELWTSG